MPRRQETRGQKAGIKTGDSREMCRIDRIVAWTFKIARDLKPGTISRSWVASFLKRSELFVTRNWRNNPYDALTEEDEEEQRALSQESKEIIREFLLRPKKQSVRTMVAHVQKKRHKKRSYGTIYNFLKEEKAKAFHMISKPWITELNVANRLDFCEFLRDWDENDFLFLAPSDEFFVYADRKPNSQNDRIWAYSLEDISDEHRIRKKTKFPKCVGIFLCFTARKMMWVLKEQGESWDGPYFRQKILLDTVIPFLQDPENVLSVAETTFLHDIVPCMRAVATQQLLRSNQIDFFDNSQWPGASPDLNVAENMGAILKDRTEEALSQRPSADRLKESVLFEVLNDVLSDLEYDTELFEALLKSYPAHIKAVKEAFGGHTEY